MTYSTLLKYVNNESANKFITSKLTVYESPLKKVYESQISINNMIKFKKSKSTCMQICYVDP